jgi:hypothetical protein
MLILNGSDILGNNEMRVTKVYTPSEENKRKFHEITWEKFLHFLGWPTKKDVQSRALEDAFLQGRGPRK